LTHLAVCGCFTSKAGPQREPQVSQAAVEHSWRRTRRKRRQQGREIIVSIML
jgi:hypothetical protein